MWCCAGRAPCSNRCGRQAPLWDGATPGDHVVLRRSGALLEPLWPLAPGKQAAVTHSDGGSTVMVTMRVLRRETVEVDAGRFDTFVIEYEDRGTHGANLSTMRWWYAPELGTFV